MRGCTYDFHQNLRLLSQGSVNFFYKDQVVNISVFVGHMASLATIQLWHYNEKAVKDNM